MRYRWLLEGVRWSIVLASLAFMLGISAPERVNSSAPERFDAAPEHFNHTPNPGVAASYTLYT